MTPQMLVPLLLCASVAAQTTDCSPSDGSAAIAGVASDPSNDATMCYCGTAMTTANSPTNRNLCNAGTTCTASTKSCTCTPDAKNLCLTLHKKGAVNTIRYDGFACIQSGNAKWQKFWCAKTGYNVVRADFSAAGCADDALIADSSFTYDKMATSPQNDVSGEGGQIITSWCKDGAVQSSDPALMAAAPSPAPSPAPVPAPAPGLGGESSGHYNTVNPMNLIVVFALIAVFMW